MSKASVISIESLSKSYREGERELHILKDVSLELAVGDSVALIGASGSGKSTLLHCAALLDQADAGAVIINGENMCQADDRMRTELRRTQMGFVYQFHHLLGELTALENVMLPIELIGEPAKEAEEKASRLLEDVGLAERVNHMPQELSGGERQRVAIARALANDPKVLFADEPTGNLDEATAQEVMSLLHRTIEERGMAALIATHNNELADGLSRAVRLRGGALEVIR